MSPHPHNKLDRHLGTRGWILLLCAGLWWLIGLGVLLQAARGDEPALLHLYAPPGVRLAAWWVPAALAVYGAFARKHIDVVFFALMLMPAVRTVSYGWAWVTWLVDQVGWLWWIDTDMPGMVTGWYSAAYHVGLVALVLIAAHTKETTRDGVK